MILIYALFVCKESEWVCLSNPVNGLCRNPGNSLAPAEIIHIQWFALEYG